MLIRTIHRRRLARAGQAGLIALLLVPWHAANVWANGWPDKVSGRYKITFNGIDIGKLKFESTADSNGYSLSANAKLSALGLFKWSGKSTSSGTLRGDDPRPSGYTFEFKSDSKDGSVEMAFSGATVTNTTVVPPPKSKRKTVPIEDKHLKNVLDPLSAVLALSRANSANPCDQHIAIFDGKQRFDLVLSPQGKEQVNEKRPSGQPDMAYVCRVRYIPIAGHKENDDDSPIIKTDGIEVVLRPVPSANILVPYKVRISTIAGPAVVTSERVEITTGADEIALVH